MTVAAPGARLSVSGSSGNGRAQPLKLNLANFNPLVGNGGSFSGVSAPSACPEQVRPCPPTPVVRNELSAHRGRPPRGGGSRPLPARGPLPKTPPPATSSGTSSSFLPSDPSSPCARPVALRGGSFRRPLPPTHTAPRGALSRGGARPQSTRGLPVGAHFPTTSRSPQSRGDFPTEPITNNFPRVTQSPTTVQVHVAKEQTSQGEATRLEAAEQIMYLKEKKAKQARIISEEREKINQERELAEAAACKAKREVEELELKLCQLEREMYQAKRREAEAKEQVELLKKKARELQQRESAAAEQAEIEIEAALTAKKLEQESIKAAANKAIEEQQEQLKLAEQERLRREKEARFEAERKAKEEAARKVEEERLALEEANRKAEEERRAAEKRNAKAKEDQERRERDEQKAREEEEAKRAHQLQEEINRIKRQIKEEQERKEKEAQERKAKEEANRKFEEERRAEEERKAKAKEDQERRERDEQKAREEEKAKRAHQLEEEINRLKRQIKEEQERKEKEQERETQEKADILACEEQASKLKEEQDRIAKEEHERQLEAEQERAALAQKERNELLSTPVSLGAPTPLMKTSCLADHDPPRNSKRLSHATALRPQVGTSRRRPSSVRGKTCNFDPDLLKKSAELFKGGDSPKASNAEPEVEPELGETEEENERKRKEAIIKRMAAQAGPTRMMLPIGGITLRKTQPKP